MRGLWGRYGGGGRGGRTEICPATGGRFSGLPHTSGIRSAGPSPPAKKCAREPPRLAPPASAAYICTLLANRPSFQTSIPEKNTGLWHSWLARYLDMVEVAGSSPANPTEKGRFLTRSALFLCNQRSSSPEYDLVLLSISSGCSSGREKLRVLIRIIL